MRRLQKPLNNGPLRNPDFEGFLVRGSLPSKIVPLLLEPRLTVSRAGGLQMMRILPFLKRDTTAFSGCGFLLIWELVRGSVMRGQCAGALERLRWRLFFYECGFEYSFFGVREGGKDVLGHFVDELGSPKWVAHVVIDNANMVKVKGDIRFV